MAEAVGHLAPEARRDRAADPLQRPVEHHQIGWKLEDLETVDDKEGGAELQRDRPEAGVGDEALEERVACRLDQVAPEIAVAHGGVGRIGQPQVEHDVYGTRDKRSQDQHGGEPRCRPLFAGGLPDLCRVAGEGDGHCTPRGEVCRRRFAGEEVSRDTHAHLASMRLAQDGLVGAAIIGTAEGDERDVGRVQAESGAYAFHPGLDPACGEGGHTGLAPGSAVRGDGIAVAEAQFPCAGHLREGLGVVEEAGVDGG